LLTIDEALRTLEAADADEVHDAWRDLRWPVLIHGFDLMGARGLAGVGTTYIRWVGAQAYERGDAEILAHLHRYYVQLGM